MIRLGMVWALARAETRLTRRLVRYWIFQSLAFLIGLLTFVYYGGIHWFVSHFSATVALIGPRYLAGYLGIWYIVIFLIGLIFLGFDVRARDTRERMVEVLDALPVSNIELLLGRFLGILIPAWVPVIVMIGIFTAIGMPLGEEMQPLSLVTFSVFMVIPAYCFALGLTFFFTLLLRHRLAAALVLVVIVIGLVSVNMAFVDVGWLPMVDLTGGFVVPAPSDLMPTVIDWRGLLQRGGILIIGLGMLWFGAAIHPRRDDSSRPVNAAIGGVLLLAGLGMCYVLVAETSSLLNKKQTWKEAHAARADDPTPDLVRLTGDVRIRSGELAMELSLTFRAREGQPLDSALFSLNPGLEVLAASGPGGGELSFEQQHGLLEIRLASALAAGETTTVAVKIEGKPEPFFGYLDSVIEPFQMNVQEGNIFLLGFLPVIASDRYVALLPGVRWLPATGSEIGRGDPRRRPQDFFSLNLTVEVPAGWLVAGPGRRHEAGELDDGKGVRFRFEPPAPLPDVALIAGRFESRSAEVAGVTLEVLLHPGHAGNLDFFADAAKEIQDWMGNRLEEAAEYGLAYPYDALTMVEVPGSLRGYAGGWRMDTTMTQPAMILTREAGFPTARFDVPFRDPDDFEDEEGGIPRAKREMLERFFETDFSGGNPFIAAARSFFSYQTAGQGPEGLPLDFVWEDLSARLITEKQGYFSVHHYGADLGQTMNSVMGNVFSSDNDNVADVIIQSITARTDVWDAVLGVSLGQLDPWQEPKRSLDVLTLKGGGMSRSLLDGLGPAKAGQLLAVIRRDGAGGVFTRDDVIAAGEEIGEDLESWLDVWIDQTQLAGFTVGPVRSDRITDSEEGTPRYQVIAVIRNSESTAGMLKISYKVGEGSDSTRETIEPIAIPGDSSVEIGIVASEPIESMKVDPYLSLNRHAFNLQLPGVDHERIVEAEPFIGVRPTDWFPADDGTIVVDDLDEGFEIQEGDKGSTLRVEGQGEQSGQTDAGLPVAEFGRPSRWSRRNVAAAWGAYRHTTALIRGGKGGRNAAFNAELPLSGPWELEYHLPPARKQGRKLNRGTWNLTLTDTSGSHEIPFDADGGEAGWNALGTFELAAGEVSLTVSNQTDGRFVLADAVRFRPVPR